MINYFATAGIVLAISVIVGLLLRNKIVVLLDAVTDNAVAVFALVVALIFIVLGMYKLEALAVGLWDFGIYDSLLHNAVSGQGIMRDFRGPFDHFSPALLLLVPLYWLNDTPYHLVIFQALVMAAGGVVFFMLASTYFRKNAIPALLTLMYFCDPYYTRFSLYDFHIECLFPLVFFGAFLAYARKKYLWFAILILALPMIKEDFIAATGAVGLFFLFRRREWKYGALFIAGALFWTFFVLKIYYPLILRSDYIHYSRYGLIGSDLSATLHNIGRLAMRPFSLETCGVLLSILLPFAFLPLLHWRMFLLLVMPVLGIQLVSTAIHQNLLMSHYSSAIIAVMPLAALWGIRVTAFCRRRENLRKSIIGVGLILSVACNAVYTEMPLVAYYTYVQDLSYDSSLHGGLFGIPFRSDWLNVLKKRLACADQFKDVATQIPRDVSVSVMHEVSPLFIRNRKINELKDNAVSDYYVFSVALNRNFQPNVLVSQAINKKLADPRYRIWFNNGDTFIIADKKMKPFQK